MGMFDDQFGDVANFNVDMHSMRENLLFLTEGKEFDFTFYENLFNKLDCYAGLNLIDFYILHKYIQKRNIKKVTELGCGSTSVFLDSISIKRESFEIDQALTSTKNTVNFNKCNIYESADKINESCKDSDLILIDSQHSRSMASFYYKNILMNNHLPVFLHDFMAPGKQTYSEQIFWVRYLLNKKYKLFIATDCLFPDQIYKISRDVPPVSAIFEPINK